MAKEREGKFHPAKGKPSGANKEEGLGLRKTLDPEELDRDLEMTERYTTGSDRLSDNIHMRHRNRNAGRGVITRSVTTTNKSRHEAFTEETASTDENELVSFIPKELFTYLSTYRSGICVSIILPTHAAGVEVNDQVDLIEFKTALQQVEKMLAQKNISQASIKKMIHHAYDLLRDEEIWYQMSHGLAVYMAEDFFKFIRLPGNVKKEILVSSSFSVMPLVPFMVRKEFFYILSLNKKNSRFYRADSCCIEHIPVDELPVGLDDVVHFENKDGQKLFRLANNGAKGANYHGIGSGKPDDKQNIALYLEEVDRTLWQTHLHYSNVPLLLAGADYMISIYRSVSGYKFIWPEALKGNHQHDGSDTLYRQALKIMKPYFDQDMKNALDEYGNKSSTPLTSTKNSEIIPAAYYGRISHLFIQKDTCIWGTFNEVSGALKMMDEEKGNAENLADKTVAKTIESGGAVFILDKADMPGTGNLAAIFRYQSIK